MNFHDAQTSRVLKQHYEKLLLSYDVYETGIYEEQTDIANAKGSSSQGRNSNGRKLFLVDSNGTTKNGNNKRKDRSPSPHSNNVDPVRILFFFLSNHFVLF